MSTKVIDISALDADALTNLMAQIDALKASKAASDKAARDVGKAHVQAMLTSILADVPTKTFESGAVGVPLVRETSTIPPKVK